MKRLSLTGALAILFLTGCSKYDEKPSGPPVPNIATSTISWNIRGLKVDWTKTMVVAKLDGKIIATAKPEGDRLKLVFRTESDRPSNDVIVQVINGDDVIMAQNYDFLESTHIRSALTKAEKK